MRYGIKSLCALEKNPGIWNGIPTATSHFVLVLETVIFLKLPNFPRNPERTRSWYSEFFLRLRWSQNGTVTWNGKISFGLEQKYCKDRNGIATATQNCISSGIGSNILHERNSSKDLERNRSWDTEVFSKQSFSLKRTESLLKHGTILNEIFSEPQVRISDSERNSYWYSEWHICWICSGVELLTKSFSWASQINVLCDSIGIHSEIRNWIIRDHFIGSELNPCWASE